MLTVGKAVGKLRVNRDMHNSRSMRIRDLMCKTIAHHARSASIPETDTSFLQKTSTGSKIKGKKMGVMLTSLLES